MHHMTRIHPDELPDGSSFMPPRIQPDSGANSAGDQTVVRPCEYIGSFPVEGSEQKDRADFVRQKLENMRIVPQSKSVLLVMSLSGVKVCSETGESVHMAHALRRISYATCDPDHCQFSFLAREPKGQASVQYCHAFLTDTPEQSEELNNILGDAFKLAYAQQRQAKALPSFNEMIEQQLQMNRQRMEEAEHQAQEEFTKKLRRISTPSAVDLAAQRKEMRKKSTDESPPPPTNQASAQSSQPQPRPSSGSATKHTSQPAPAAPRLKSRGAATSTANNNNASSSNATGVANSNNSGQPITSSSGQGQMSSATSIKPPNQAAPSIADSLVDAGITLKGYGSPVVAIKERLDAAAAALTSAAGGKALPPPPSLPLPPTPVPTRPPPIHQLSEDATPPRYYCNTRQSQGSEEEAPPQPPVRYNSLRRYDVPGGFADQEWCAPSAALSPVPSGDSSESYGEEPGLLRAPWYQAAIPREIALEVLAQEEVGSFVVRDSTSHPGCYALSVKVPKFDNPSGITHYLIQRTQRGVKLKGLEKEWPSLQSLVTHLTVMPEMLPCTLKLPRDSRNPAFAHVDTPGAPLADPSGAPIATAAATAEEDEDYQRLSDFSSIMADLRVNS